MTAHSKNILWVDDDAQLMAYSVEQLRDYGFSITSSHSIQDAIHHLKSNNFDLLITDNQMPGEPEFPDIATLGGQRTGVLFSQYVRLHFPSLPIIMASAYPQQIFDTQYLFNNGIMVYSKISPTSELINMIETLPEFQKAPRAIEAVDLKPGMFGVSLDIKKFIKYMRNTK